MLMQAEEMSDNIANDRFADQGVQPIDPAHLDVLNELNPDLPKFPKLPQ